jgi:mRNA interferase RelE/StbE
MLPVGYTINAKKYFKKLKDKQLKENYRAAIIDIRNNPYIGEAKTGDLKGIYCLNVHYRKVNYELAYRVTELDNGDMVVIIMAGTRENFYKELKRYMD